MKKLDTSQAISVLANIGVLVGIVFVGYELRQSNRIAVGTTSYELSRNWITVNDMILTNPEVLALVVDLKDENFQPESDLRSELTATYARRLLSNWIAIQEAYDNGLVSEDLYDIALAEVSRIVTERPALVGQFANMPSAWLNNELMQPILTALEDRHSP